MQCPGCTGSGTRHDFVGLGVGESDVGGGVDVVGGGGGGVECVVVERAVVRVGGGVDVVCVGVGPALGAEDAALVGAPTTLLGGR